MTEEDLPPLGRHFAASMSRLSGETDPGVLRAAALACLAVQDGHTCARLEDLAGIDPSRLARSPLVGDGSARTPLVLENDRLYLRRYFDLEQRVARALGRRATARAPVVTDALPRRLDELFPDPREALQKQAAFVAVTRRLCAISGGPGTGKTRTVARILQVMAEETANAGRRPGRVCLAAPTGKAAKRLEESIASALGDAATGGAHVPREASTLHRLLGYRGHGRFTHGPDNPLAADVVIVDEASMVDLDLMLRLLEALPDDARLLLLGDRDQLASVEAGLVFADICDGLEDTGAVVVLEHSWRYAGGSAIGRLARAVVSGDADEALRLLTDPDADSVRLIPSGPRGALPAALTDDIVARYRQLTDPDPARALAALDSFRILAAHREGTSGVAGLNAQVHALLTARRLIPPRAENYPGRPILVTRNDHEQKLYNGDTGLFVTMDSTLRVLFPDPPAPPRPVLPSWLPAHQTVYTMSVHQSQGSELDEIVVVLPGSASSLMTRELLYTAVTRARTSVHIVGSPAVLRAAIHTPVTRHSGLAQALQRP